MKKRNVICGIGLVVFIMITVGGICLRQTHFTKYDPADLLILSSDDIACIQDISLDLQSQGLEEAEMHTEVKRFASWVGTFKPSRTQKDVVLSLFAEGADLNDLYAICRFWEDTDADFSIVREIWENHPTEGEVKDPIVWIENVYNALSDKTDEALSVEEVRGYFSEGLTYDDIMAANRLSRKSGVDIHDILEQVQNGAEWESIIVPEADAQLSTLAKQYTACELLDSIIIARKTNCTVSDVLFEAAEKQNDDVDDADIGEWYQDQCSESVQHDLHIADILS